MKFGRIPTATASGTILGHSVTLPGGALKKGRLLDADDVVRLQSAGVADVWAAELEAGDVREDEAATKVAAALKGPGVRAEAAFTGRVNLFAQTHGLFRLDLETITNINSIDEGLTVATLPDYERVTPGTMIATIKIIPFSLDESVLLEAVHIAERVRAPLSVAPFRRMRAGLILTEVASTKSSVLDKRERVIADRVTALGGEIVAVTRVAHDVELLAGAIADMSQKSCEPVLVFGASAIVDRDDVVPAALQLCGGRVVQLGMPVDPGNLLMMGDLGGRAVIGVPSCAASPKLNGFDWVLAREAAGLRPGTDELRAMGVGGLLMEIASRPQPRIPAAEPAGDLERPRIAALVLAAGRASRMGSNKLLEKIGDLPVLAHVLSALQASSTVAAGDILAVTGHQADAVAPLLAAHGIRTVHNPNYAQGLSTSLAAGIGELGSDIDGVFVCLGDMPDITANHLDRLAKYFAPERGRSVCVPVCDGKRGNPVLWGAEFFAELKQVVGDTGARHLIGQHADKVAEVDMADDAVLIDIDTPEALAAARLRAGETDSVTDGEDRIDTRT